MEYDRQLRWLFEAQEKVKLYIFQNQEYAFRLFSTSSFGKKVNPIDSFGDLLWRNDSVLFRKPVPLLNSSPAFIDEVYGFRLEFADYMTDLLFNYHAAYERGKRLIDFLIKEYHLK
jgi:hypothetical protein